MKKINHFGFNHYGNYEIKELKRFNKQFNNIYDDILEKIIANSINVLKYFYSDVYPPTFSNSLKEIANHVGFNWSNNEASGLSGIVWRKKWELTSEKHYKARLIQYNLEDCLALLEVKIWLSNISNTAKKEIFTITNIINNSHLMSPKEITNVTYARTLEKTSQY